MQEKRRRRTKRDRAVSEAIGFIIIFGIIIGGVGIVTLYGYPMLTQRQTSADEQIMEKNMIVLQNDLKSIAYKTVPYTETSLKVGSGTLTVYNMTYDNATESHFDVYDNQGLIATSANPLVFYSGDLRYDSTSAETDLSLENGAVVKRLIAENGSTMLANPRWYYDSQTNTAVIYLIGFSSASDIMSQTGVGTVKMNLEQTNYMPYVLPAGDILYVRYLPNNNADYSAAWYNYFEGMNMAETGAPGEYKWLLNSAQPANVVIYQYQVNIESV